jgi:hypothetical protein
MRGDAHQAAGVTRVGSRSIRATVAVDLAGAGDHGVHRIENDCEQHPEDRGEEQTADDLAYRMGLEEAG